VLNTFRDIKEVVHMYCSEFTNFSYWWIFPILMMVLCFLMMRGRRRPMMYGFGSRDVENGKDRVTDSALDILNKRYASGEINKKEYEEKKRTLTESIDISTN